MKLVDHYIQEYKYKIYEEGFTFGDEDYFKYGYVYEELYELSDIADKITLLKFLKMKMEDEYDNLKSSINVKNDILKDKKSKIDKNRREELRDELDYEKRSNKNIAEMIEDLTREINEHLMLINVDQVEKVKAKLNEIDNINLKRQKNIKNIKMNWIGDITLLPYLFDELYNQGFISKSDFNRRIEFIINNFNDENGESFKKKNIEQSIINARGNKTKKPRGAYKIEKVIDNAKKRIT